MQATGAPGSTGAPEEPCPDHLSTRACDSLKKARQENRDAALCAICPCSEQPRREQQCSSVQVIPIIDTSTSMIYARSRPPPGDVPMRDAALEITGHDGWRRAVEKVVDAARAHWADKSVSIGFGNSATCAGTGSARPAANAPAVWTELPDPFTTSGHGRTNRPSPLAGEILRLVTEIKGASAQSAQTRTGDADGPCEAKLLVLISDGLEQNSIHAKTNGAMKKAVDDLRAFAATSPGPELARIRLFFAHAQPISDETAGEALAGQCQTMKQIAADKKHLSDFACVEVDIDNAALLTQADYVKESSKALETNLRSYIDEVARDMSASCQAIRYFAAQQGPREPADAVVTGNDGAWTCSGVAVDEDVVLTAAHCLPITRVLVTEDVTQGGTIHAVLETARHPVAEVDAALVRTATRVTDRPATLRETTSSEPPVGTVRFVGFGATSVDGQSGFGRRHWIDLTASGWGCDGDRVETKGCRPGWEMVLPGSMGHDTCGGDSGGPVYELWGDQQACGYRVIGIVARHTADAVVPCGNGGIYTRVDAIRTWIDTVREDFRARSRARQDSTKEGEP
jgi:hypothetical protein